MHIQNQQKNVLKKIELLGEFDSLSSSVIPDLLRSDPDGRQDRDFSPDCKVYGLPPID